MSALNQRANHGDEATGEVFIQSPEAFLERERAEAGLGLSTGGDRVVGDVLDKAGNVLSYIPRVNPDRVDALMAEASTMPESSGNKHGSIPSTQDNLVL